jgi:hypothetical protein
LADKLKDKNVEQQRSKSTEQAKVAPVIQDKQRPKYVPYVPNSAIMQGQVAMQQNYSQMMAQSQQQHVVRPDAYQQMQKNLAHQQQQMQQQQMAYMSSMKTQLEAQVKAQAVQLKNMEERLEDATA